MNQIFGDVHLHRLDLVDMWKARSEFSQIDSNIQLALSDCERERRIFNTHSFRQNHLDRIYSPVQQ